LYAQDAISEREHDLAETEYLLARARMDRADAARADARRNLRYTTVRAPVAGATDWETVSEGNLVEFGSLLTTITQQDPVHLRFAIPENDAMIQRAARDALSGDGKKRRYEALLILPDGTQYSEKGEIDFTASTINPETGSVTAGHLSQQGQYPDSGAVPPGPDSARRT
jgi:membrane fusion protein, multidrug efflux system